MTRLRLDGALRGRPTALWLTIALLATLAPAGCKEDPTGDAVSVAFRELVDTLQRRDGAALWELTTKPTRDFCETLHAELAEAERLIEVYFPEWQRQDLVAKLALERFGGTKDGRDVFVKLLDFAQLREGDAVDAGLAHDPPQILNNRAILKTTAGESFSFVLEADGAWRTDVYESLQVFPLVQTLRENMGTLRENVARLKQLYATAKDPTSPEGAFNQLRDSLGRADGRVLSTLLDEPGRKALAELQRLLAKLAAEPAATRDTRLEGAQLKGLDPTAASASPAALATELAKRGTLGELLQVERDSAVYVVRLQSRTEATVVTTDAIEIDFVREADGLWHVAEAGSLLRTALLERISATP